MAIIQYSPWKDAASVGQGLGDTLAQTMMQLPLMRAQLEEHRQRMAMQQQLAKTHGEYYGAEAELARARTSEVKQKNLAEQESARHLGNFVNHMKLVNDRIQMKLDPSESLNVAMTELTASDPKHIGELAKTLLLEIGGAYTDQSKAFAAGSPAGASAGRLSLNQVNPLLGTSGAMEPKPGETISVPQLGTNAPTTFQGPERQFAPEHLGSTIPVLLGSQSPLSESNKASLADTIYGRLTNSPAFRVTSPTNAPTAAVGKPLTAEIAAEFLRQAGGDKERARQLARQAGYEF